VLSNDKIEAIYDLREAVEAKVRAEQRLAQLASPEARAELLDATLEVEARTQTAIEICHKCGREHASSEPHDNVIEVDFRINPDAEAT
jgi:hypothetical protein